MAPSASRDASLSVTDGPGNVGLPGQKRSGAAAGIQPLVYLHSGAPEFGTSEGHEAVSDEHAVANVTAALLCCRDAHVHATGLRFELVSQLSA